MKKQWKNLLRNKVMLSILTAGVLSSCVMGNANAAYIAIDGEVRLENGYTYTDDFVYVGTSNSNKLIGNNTALSFDFDKWDENTSSDYYNGLQIADAASAVFGGEYFTVNGTYSGELGNHENYALVVNRNGSLNIDAKNASIGVSGENNNTWNFAVYLNSNAKVEFSEQVQNVSISGYNKDYTTQVLTVRGGSEMNFNNIGDVTINASGISVTAIDQCVADSAVLKFNNQGNVYINTTIEPDGESGTINSIAYQSYGGAQMIVTDNVDTFKITQEGIGVDNDGTSYSSGSMAFFLGGDDTVEINSKNFIIDSTVSSGVQVTDPDRSSEVYAIFVDCGSTFNVGSDTVTEINVENGVGSAFGIYADNWYGGGIVNILGDISLSVTGSDASDVKSLAVYAGNGSEINLGSEGKTISIIGDIVADNAIDDGDVVGNAGNIVFSGKTVSLAGDVLADNGTITLQGSDNTVDGVITAINSGEVKLTGENAVYTLQHMEASNGGKITVGEGTTIAVDSANLTDGNYLVTLDNGALNVASDSKLRILNAAKGQTFNIVEGSDEEAWAVENISADNFMLQYEKVDDSNDYIITTTVADAAEVFDGAVIIPTVLTQTLEQEDAGNAAFDFFNSITDAKLNTKEQAVKAINNAASMSELAGVSRGTYSASNILTDAVADHMSLAKNLDHDTDIWAHYAHTKENIDGLAAGSGGARYDAQYNGIVVGADLYKQGKATVGAALTYIDGKMTGAAKNEAEYYGLSIYGGIENEDSAVIGDISYLHGKNEISQYNSGYTLTGEPKSDALSVGVRAEKSFKAGNGKLVPYAGLRYLHLGTGNYTNSIGLKYDADDVNLFLLPVGVKYSAEHKTAGWTLRPIVEAGYVWAMGDRDSEQTVSLSGASDGFGYDVTDSGSYFGRLAVEAEKANVTYSLGYEYQKGDSVKANKWMANLNWKF